MSEMNERKVVECAQELATQIENGRTEFGGKYVVNEHNMKKFSKVYDFFRQIADEDGGEVRCFDVHPESVSASVSIEISLLDLYRDSLKQFVDILQYIDVFEASPTDDSDGILITVSVTNVWEDVE